ncbi:hypothetical protein J0H58_26005 [bacterium]|nr:hypothetical protein [bacterium]
MTAPPDATPDDLVLTPPNRVARAGHTVEVGPTVWVALRVLNGTAGRRLPVAALCRAVWGTDAVPAGTVWSLCHRANRHLGRLGHAARCGVDQGDVVLV